MNFNTPRGRSDCNSAHWAVMVVVGHVPEAWIESVGSISLCLSTRFTLIEKMGEQ